MPYGYQFASKSKLTTWAKEHAASNPDVEYQLALAIEAWNAHKLAQEAFIEFIYQAQLESEAKE